MRIPIRINPLFWLLAVLIGVLNSQGDLAGIVIWVIIVFVSVLVHEFGHALTAKFFGQQASIELMALGGLTHRQGPPLNLWREFIVVFNGPLAGFLLAIICGLLTIFFFFSHPMLATVMMWTAYANIFWTVFNLLPVQPLDGGKLLMIVMEGMFGLKGMKIALFISLLASVGLGLFGFAFGQFILGAIFFMLAFESFRMWQGSLVMTENDRNEELRGQFQLAEQLLAAGKTLEAERILKAIRGKVNNGFLYLGSTELLGQLAAQNGDYENAYSLLSSIESHLTDDSLALFHQIAYRTGHWKRAIEIGDKAFQNRPTYETAVLNAFSHALMGEVQPAIGWLQRAVEEGLPDIQQIIRQKEFDPIRSSPQFNDFVSSVT